MLICPSLFSHLDYRLVIHSAFLKTSYYYTWLLNNISIRKYFNLIIRFWWDAFNNHISCKDSYNYNSLWRALKTSLKMKKRCLLCKALFKVWTMWLLVPTVESGLKLLNLQRKEEPKSIWSVETLKEVRKLSIKSNSWQKVRVYTWS